MEEALEFLKEVQGMKRLQIIALRVSIFAIAAFGINQCAILFHKAESAWTMAQYPDKLNRSL